jgi:protein translocase SEC61 complex gamma subunit
VAVGSFIRSAIRTLKLARKANREELVLYLKLVGLGLAVVGTLGFVIQFVASLIKLAAG